MTLLAGTEWVWVEAWKDGAAALLPLAPGISILNEVGTVLIDRIISQVHTDLILGKDIRPWVRLKYRPSGSSPCTMHSDHSPP